MLTSSGQSAMARHDTNTNPRQDGVSHESGSPTLHNPSQTQHNCTDESFFVVPKSPFHALHCPCWQAVAFARTCKAQYVPADAGHVPRLHMHHSLFDQICIMMQMHTQQTRGIVANMHRHLKKKLIVKGDIHATYLQVLVPGATCRACNNLLLQAAEHVLKAQHCMHASLQICTPFKECVCMPQRELP